MAGRRLILLVPLLAMFAFVATIEERAEAADPQLVEGETFAPTSTTGARVVSDAMFSNGQALKFLDNTTTATKRVNFGSQGDIVLVARGGQSGGPSTLSVSVDGVFRETKAISNNGAPVAYTYNLDVPAGDHTIGVRAGNTGTGRYPFLDYATFPAGSGGGTTPTDTDGDGVPDDTDQCDTKPGPASNNGCPVTTLPTDWNCSGTDINRGDDIDAIINDRPRGPTRFCVHAGEYQVSDVARLKDGDTLDAQPGDLEYVGPATKPTPVVKLVGSSTENLLSALGSNITIKWVDLRGASGTGNGTGSAIAAGSADSNFLVQYSRIHNNDSVGISNAKGRILDSEFFSNSEASGSIGFNASAIKGITQFEAGRLYVHDEQGNGIWCDVGCDHDSVENGFWVHDSVVVRSDRAGIRYENSATGALIEDNEIHANGLIERRGGVDIRDSQNARVEDNNFGPETIAGVSYAANRDRIGVRATDSGRSDRVNLADIDVVGNTMDGDRIVSCGPQVTCIDNF